MHIFVRHEHNKKKVYGKAVLIFKYMQREPQSYIYFHMYYSVQTSYFVILLPKYCFPVKSCPCISFLIASVCVLSSKQLGIIKHFRKLAVKSFSFILTSLCLTIFFVCLVGLPAHVLWNVKACILVQHQIKCTYIYIFIFFARKEISLYLIKAKLPCWFDSKKMSTSEQNTGLFFSEMKDTTQC